MSPRKTFLGAGLGPPPLREEPFRTSPAASFIGLRLVVDPHLLVPGIVSLDGDPFIEYEEKDLGWRLYFGFARRGMVPDPQVYINQASGRIIGHPVTIEKLVALLKGSDKVLVKPDQLPKLKPFPV